jgi:isocitrate dehydrogenase
VSPSLQLPPGGERITMKDGEAVVPPRPYVGFIEGDGIGPDIWRASKRVFDAAVEKAYRGERQIMWAELLAGEKAHKATGEWLPEATVEAIRDLKAAIKGPLTTPVGGGIRSLNVALRQKLDLYACIRPVRWFEGVPSPLKNPERVNVVIFRENTEDVYAGIEWAAGTKEANRMREFLKKELNVETRENSAYGVKPMSAFGSKRLVRRALKYALRHGKPSVTLVHKGNIMKYTEGAFRDWGYELAKEEFSDRVAPEAELEKTNWKAPEGKIVIKDRIADSMFQQMLLRPDEYSVLATPNLNGDYLSDACAAEVGGLGIAPGANVGDEAAVFEATHGTPARSSFRAS